MSFFFNGSSSYIPVSLHGQTQETTNRNLEFVRDIARYQLLYDNMLNRMRQYLNLYTEGSYNELKQEFTLTRLNELLASNNDSVYYNANIEDLVNFTYDETTFRQYKRSMYSMLTGFSLSVKQYDEVLACNSELAEKKELLSSKEKLIEYITTEFTDKMSMEAFYITQKFNTNVLLKPWYNLYLQLYGAPYDGVFNAEKMANVVEILVNDNVITIEQFVADYV